MVLLIPVSAWADLDLPVNGPITSGVGWRVDPFGSGRLVYHRGIDIAVPVGTPVRATRRGRIAFAAVHGGHGATVIIEHDNGGRTLYGHNSSLSVRRGELVDAGTVVALSGNSGRSTGPHIHYEVLAGGRPLPDVAQVEKSAAEQEHPIDRDLRHHHEQRIEDAMNSILRKINSPLAPSGSAGQGG
ncbi:M23 family metallopeptidase [Geobacter grbiciae]|nr:M23 family metallopeptidase [Geobacter grbiciae]